MRLRTHLKLKEAIASGTHSEFIDGASDKERLEMIIASEEIYPLPKGPDPERVRFMAQKHNLYINIMDMSLGQFIMLENEIRAESSRDDVISSLIIRPKEEKSYDNEDYKREDEILELLLDEDIRDVHSVISSMMLNRELILFGKFSGVLYSRVEVSEEDEEEEEVKGNGIDEEAFGKQWFWYSIVRTLAQDNIMRFNDIYELKMSVVMVELSFLSQKSILENARIRSEEARAKSMYRR